MTYTFQPLASIPVDHVGFGLIVTMFVFITLVVAMSEGLEGFLAMFFVSTIVCLIAYGVSYHWTNQEPKTFVNEQVTGELVGFVAEGYNIPVASGKSTRHVDYHETYVVYKVNGEKVMMSAKLGQTYPDRAVLYKN